MNTTTFQNYLQQCFSGYNVSSRPPNNTPSYAGIGFYINRKQTASSSAVFPDSTDVVSSESDKLKKLPPSRTLTGNDGKNQSSIVKEQIRRFVRETIQKLQNNYKILVERSIHSHSTVNVLKFIDLDFQLLDAHHRDSAKISDQFQKEIGSRIQRETCHIHYFIEKFLPHFSRGSKKK